MTQPQSYRSMTLNISQGTIETAKKVVIYGPEGIGKSTLASKFPSPLFLDVEHGTKALNVTRVNGLDTWEALRGALKSLHSSHGNFRTIVIDTADWAERLCITYVCAQSKKSGIEDFGYGKGYVYLKEEFAKLLGDCDALIAKGINVVFTAHAAMRKFEQPDEKGAYDRWEMKLTKYNAPMLKEWADMVLFCNYRTYTQRQENGKYKVTGGERTMYTTHNPCWDAKNRYGLADELPMDYTHLAAAVEIHAAEKSEEEPAAEKTDPPAAEKKSAPQKNVKLQKTEPAAEPLICADCGQVITGIGTHNAEAIAQRSMDLFGRRLCVNCAVKAKKEMKTSA